jgi:hypothetical protein
MADQSHQLPRSVQRKGTRPPVQVQPSLLRSAVALRVVALVAARHQIFPRRPPAARSRHHVIQRQFRRRKNSPAKLAGIVIAQQNIFSRQSASLLRNVPVRQQPNYRRHFQGRRAGAHFRSVQLLGLRHSLQQQHHRAAHRRHIDRLERCVQHQHRFLHHGRLPRTGKRGSTLGRTGSIPGGRPGTPSVIPADTHFLFQEIAAGLVSGPSELETQAPPVGRSTRYRKRHDAFRTSAPQFPAACIQRRASRKHII